MRVCERTVLKQSGRSMIKTANFIIPLVIYPLDVMVSYNEADDVFFRRLKKYVVSDTELKDCQLTDCDDARTIMTEKNQTIIRFKPPRRGDRNRFLGVVAHECFHAASYVMYKVGMKLEIEVSDEAYSYLIQYLVQEICKKLKV